MFLKFDPDLIWAPQSLQIYANLLHFVKIADAVKPVKPLELSEGFGDAFTGYAQLEEPGAYANDKQTLTGLQGASRLNPVDVCEVKPGKTRTDEQAVAKKEKKQRGRFAKSSLRRLAKGVRKLTPSRKSPSSECLFLSMFRGKFLNCRYIMVSSDSWMTAELVKEIWFCAHTKSRKHNVCFNQ